MKIWLDTTHLETIKKATSLGILFGVTTNPALIAQSGVPMDRVLQELLDHQDGPVTAQVIAQDTQGMVQEAQELYDFSDRIIVKIPATEQGWEAIHLLSENEIPTMATVVYQPSQALMAALVGADFIAPYVSQIEKSGHNPWEILESMSLILEQYDWPPQILAASINDISQIQKCAEIGIPHITLKDAVFCQLIETVPLTQERVNQFAMTWEHAQASFLSQ